MPKLDQDEDLIKGINEDGEIPSTRISDAFSARQIYQKLCQDDKLAAIKRTLIQGMIDGNPPYTDEEAEELGININVNWGDAAEKIEQAVTPYYNMMTSVEYYARVEANVKDGDRQRRISNLITNNFHNLIRSYKGYLTQSQMVQQNMVIYGFGLFHFPSELDFRPKNIDPANVKVPKDASTDINEWEFCIVEDYYDTAKLYEHISDPERAERNGWNYEATKKAIINASDSDKDTSGTERTWEWHQRQLRNNSLYHSLIVSKVVKAGHLYIREYSGKISHYVFDLTGESEDWLCANYEAYDSFSQILILFTNGVGNGCFSGLRGLGKKVYHYGEAINRVNNSILEGTILNSSVLLQPQNSADVTKLETIQLGVFKIIPPGLKFQQLNLGASLGSAMSAAAFFQNQQQTNTASWQPTVQYNDSRRVTNKELEIAEANKSILTSSKADTFMQALDTLYEEIYRRAINLNILPEDPGAEEILAFQRDCEKDGILKAELSRPISVRATRSIGYGSAGARISMMNGIGQFIPMLPENKRNNVIRDTIAAFAGEQGVERYAPDVDNAPTGNDASIAALENNAFLIGGQVVIDPNQNHYTHATVHMQFAIELVASVSEGARTATEAMAGLQGVGPHLGLHLEYVQRDPTRREQFNQLNRQFAELMKYVDQIASMAQDEAEQEEEQPQMTPEMAKIQGQLQIAQQESQTKMQIKAAEAEQRMQLRDTKTAQDIILKNEQATASSNLE